MSQMTQTTKSNDIALLLNFPETGEILAGNKVLETDTRYKNSIFKYRVTFDKDVRRSDIPNILREFFNTGMITIDGVDHVVENHDYQTTTTRTTMVVKGTMQITPLTLTNPVKKKLTALEDFDNEYDKMVMTSPETYFRAFSYRGFDGPSFRSKLFSFVSTMGENYGYCNDKTIYHRRASLVMPKIKITKAPEDAKMFYHTHPKRDEPSLSSADDYLLYFDMSHKPRNIRHFYTVMADRMDYFHIVPKPSKKKDYVKINEDKFIEELDTQIDQAGKRLDEVMSNETYQDDLVYCEKVTREVVKWLNKKYGKYFTITYKCHYKVKKNPEEPTGDDLHLGDEFIGKALKDLKTGDASWPDFGPKDRPQEKYAYWHSKYFTMNKDVKGVGYMGLLPGDDRRLTHFLYSSYRGSEYTYDDLLSILCISNDIKIRDNKIRDGKEITSRIEDILDYLEINNEEIREDIMLYDAVVAVDAYGSLSEVIGEEHNFILPIADFSIKSVEAMDEVRSGKKDLEQAKYDIMFILKEKMAKVVADALGKRNKQLEDTRTPVAVYGQDGAAISKAGINPPVQRSKREYKMSLPSKIFDNPELLSEILEPFKKNEQLRNKNNTYSVIIPVDNSAVTFVIQSTGTVQVISPSAGYPRADDPDEATLQAVRKLVDKLNEFGFEIDTSDIAFGTIEPMRNPRSGVIVAVTGPIRSTKNKFIDSLSKRMDAHVVTTFTTKTLKEYEKKSNIVEVTDEIFDRMEINGELVVVTKSYNGHRRGFSKKDMKEKDFMLVDARIKDLHFLINASPSVISFYLHPTNTEAMIESYLLDRVSPQEAKRVAGMIDDTLDAAEGEVEHIIEYDIERPAEAIEEVYNTIPKPNPMPKSIGSVMASSNGEYYLRVKNNPSHNSCPAVTQNLEMNTRNRNSAIKADYIQYGPLNLADEDYWVKAAEHWNTTPEVAKESNCSNCVAFDISPRMLDCMPGSVQDDGQLGMCWMHNFKCHSARTCYTWAAGGPITEDSVSYDWQERSAKSNPSKKISIRIDESTNPEKKMMAVFTKPDGRTKTIHFGARGMSDYTQHKDKSRRKNYLARHGGMGEDWNDPMTAGALSRWILWGKPSLRESFNDFKKRFNMEGVMAVTNTKMNPPFTYDLMSTVGPRDIKEVDYRLFPKKLNSWDKRSDKEKERLIQKSKKFRRDLEYAYGWKGKTAKTAIEAILADYAKSFDKNGYAKVYRGLITLPSENLEEVWDKYGVGQSWSSYKEGADDYMWTVIHDMPGAVLVLVEGRVHVEDLSPTDHQLSLRIGFPLEKEIEIDNRVEVTKYSIWRIDTEDRVKKPKWKTTGKNWKPWLRRGIKPLKVVEVNQSFPAFTSASYATEATPLPNPNQDYYAIIDGKPVYPTESNPPSFIAARDPKKWAKRYDRIIKMSGKELMEEANEQAAEKGLKIEVEIYDMDMKKMLSERRSFPLPPKYEKLYEKYLLSINVVEISLLRGSTVIDYVDWQQVSTSPKELLAYLESRKRWPNNGELPYVGRVRKLNGLGNFTFKPEPSFMAAGLQNKRRFPIATNASGGYEMTEGQQGKGYYGIIKTYQAGFLEDNKIEEFGAGQSPMRTDLYQSYGWLTAYSYKENYPYPSAAAEYYLDLNKKDKLPNKEADYWNVYRPVYSGTKSNPKRNPAFIVGQGGNTFDVRVVAPTRDPIMIESLRAATDKSFKHHKWYVKHHLDYVMAIMKRMPKVMGNWDKEMVDMVWMHDYPKMMGKGQDLSVVNDLLTTHRGEDYAYQVVHQLHLMERLKKSDWNSLTEYSMVAANLSTADALAHYYGPFFQIYIDENPDMSMEEIKKSNRQKLAKDKLKLRAGPMKDGLDSIKFQYKGRKVRILGNEQIKELIEKKNPMAPGYQSYSWTTEDWRSIKVNNKGEIDYKEKCGAEGTQTPDGSPRLCLPAEVIRSLLRTESGKDVIRTQARKKARAKKGERVPWHPRIKKIWKRVKEQSPKDKKNPLYGYDPALQHNDYTLMKAPDGTVFPIDNGLAPLIQYFWDSGIKVGSNDQGWGEEHPEQTYTGLGYIIFPDGIPEQLTGIGEHKPPYEKWVRFVDDRKHWVVSEWRFVFHESELPEIYEAFGLTEPPRSNPAYQHTSFPPVLYHASKATIEQIKKEGLIPQVGKQTKGFTKTIMGAKVSKDLPNRIFFAESIRHTSAGLGGTGVGKNAESIGEWLDESDRIMLKIQLPPSHTLYLNDERYVKGVNVKGDDFWGGDKYNVWSANEIVPPKYIKQIPNTELYDVYESEKDPRNKPGPSTNPPSKVIIVSGPSGSGKSTISKTIAKELGGTLVPTVTTRSRRPKEKEGGDRIFVSKDEFKEMINNNEFVEYKQHKDGVFYGRRKTDMADISIVEVSLKGMKEYKELYPDSFSVFLEPDKSPKEIEKRLLSRGGMSEANAKARASIIPKQVAAAKTMPYDLFTKSRTGKYSEVAKEIISQIPANNPSSFSRDTERVRGVPWNVKVPSAVKESVSSLPIVEEGKIRLYRGERGPIPESLKGLKDERGRDIHYYFSEGSYGGSFYTDNLAYAWANAMSPIYSSGDKTYFDLKTDLKRTPAKLVYIDLPKSEAKKYWSGRKRFSIPGQLAQMALGIERDYPSHVAIPTKEFREKEWVLPREVTKGRQIVIDFVWDNPGWRHGEQMEDDPFADQFEE